VTPCIVTNLEENNIISVKDSVDLALSDHFMQIIEVLGKDIRKKQVYTEIRVINDNLIAKFNEVLEQTSWNDLEWQHDLNSKFNSFHSKYKEIYDSIFIKKKFDVNRKKKETLDNHWYQN